MTHTVEITFTPKYFEVCINIGNYAIDNQEIDVSRVTSDNELFELIWNRCNSSRGGGLCRIFPRPRDVHFVMFSVGRYTQYRAGIHQKSDEFPPSIRAVTNQDRISASLTLTIITDGRYSFVGVW